MKYIFSNIVVGLISITAFAQVTIENTDMFIAEDEIVGIFEDISLEDDALLINDGTIHFTNAESFENNSSTNTPEGTGTFIFNAATNQNIEGRYSSSFYNLTLSSDADLLLSNIVYIRNKLNMESGKIFTGNYSLFVQNNNLSSVNFLQSSTNTSYIVGNLYRNINGELAYPFPVGSPEYFFPLTIKPEYNFNGDIGVQFNNNYFSSTPASLDLFYEGYKFDTLLQDGAWNITSIILQNSANSFSLFAGYENFDHEFDFEDKKYAIVQKATNETTWEMSGIPYFMSNPNTIPLETVDASSCILSENVALARSSTSDLKIYNTIILNSELESRFIVPGIQNYDNTEITIYSRWGNVIYEAAPYENEFDFSDYPRGTYYYVLKYEIDGSEQFRREFIEVVK